MPEDASELSCSFPIFLGVTILDFEAETKEHARFQQPKWDIRCDIKWACENQQMIALVLLNAWMNLVFSTFTSGVKSTLKLAF